MEKNNLKNLTKANGEPTKLSVSCYLQVEKVILLLFLLLGFVITQLNANEFSEYQSSGSLFANERDSKVVVDSVPPKQISLHKKENKKLVAAILAFPVPFGFTGLHRIYLGTDPWVPLAYFVTLGGGMLLPLMDFIVIVCSNKEDLLEFENNKRLFMWVK